MKLLLCFQIVDSSLRTPPVVFLLTSIQLLLGAAEWRTVLCVMHILSTTVKGNLVHNPKSNAFKRDGKTWRAITRSGASNLVTSSWHLPGHIVSSVR